MDDETNSEQASESDIVGTKVHEFVQTLVDTHGVGITAMPIFKAAAELAAYNIVAFSLPRETNPDDLTADELESEIFAIFNRTVQRYAMIIRAALAQEKIKGEDDAPPFDIADS